MGRIGRSLIVVAPATLVVVGAFVYEAVGLAEGVEVTEGGELAALVACFGVAGGHRDVVAAWGGVAACLWVVPDYGAFAWVDANVGTRWGGPEDFHASRAGDVDDAGLLREVDVLLYMSAHGADQVVSGHVTLPS